MYGIETRRSALRLLDQGRSLNSVSRETGISRAALRAWRERIEPLPGIRPEPCAPPADSAAYVYLLGLYLGDGCVSARRAGGHVLRIACADAWPGLITLCEEAISTVRPNASFSRVRKQGCVSVESYGRHWPCLFPQAGPGRKHERRIALEPWQRELVDAHPWELVRGLVHSDGCRTENRVVRETVAGERRAHVYPRYFFTNRSEDIRRLFTDTLDVLGVAWRRSNAANISVARREAVALMDVHVGAKH
ncbi:transcriptional regulator [Streptomyces sp. BI20]|uniref:transcriptional regulator n=1 Tax=Streptomyces sp. BI20 TaxID=3403460 RepID=UPI003C7419C8